MSRTLKGNLTGKAAHGHDDIYSSVTLPQSRIDEIGAGIAECLQRDLAQYWASQVSPVDVEKFNLAMLFICLQENQNIDVGCGNDIDLYNYARGG